MYMYIQYETPKKTNIIMYNQSIKNHIIKCLKYNEFSRKRNCLYMYNKIAFEVHSKRADIYDQGGCTSQRIRVKEILILV